MPASPSLATSRSSSWWPAIVGPGAPHLSVFTICLLLLLYGYEIFNFSLSVAEEVYSYQHTLRASIAQGRWGLGLLSRVFPPMGNIPTLSTLLFCGGLGLSACILARVLFRSNGAQWAFVGIFVSSPLWPHIAEFNSVSWGVGVGCVLVTLSLLLALSGRRLSGILAMGLLALAIGIYQSFFVWFPVLLCVRYLSPPQDPWQWSMAFSSSSSGPSSRRARSVKPLDRV